MKVKIPTYKISYYDRLKDAYLLRFQLIKAFSRSEAINKFCQVCDRHPSVIQKIQKV